MRLVIVISVLVLCLGLPSIIQAQHKNNQTPSKYEQLPTKQEQLELADKLIVATKDYRASLDKIVGFAQQDITRAAETLEKRKQLFQDGLIAQRTLKESEQALTEANARLADIQKQITEAEELIAEAEASKQLAIEPSPDQLSKTSSGFIRYSGTVRWALQESGKVEQFFQANFGRPLPISAYGQTAVHDRLGFDHHNAMDVAISPDSLEGQALMRYLRDAGIPFLAFPHAIPGAATGAHIHIGRPSSRLSARPPF